MIRAWCRYLCLLTAIALVYLLLGGYVFLVMLLCVVVLPFFSLFAMQFQCHKLQLNFQRRSEGNYLYLKSGRFFPLVHLHVNVQLENQFLAWKTIEAFDFLSGEKEQRFILMKHADSMGRIRLSYDGYEIRDLLGLFRRRYKESFTRAYYLFPHVEGNHDISQLSDLLNTSEHVFEGRVQVGGILEDTHEVKEYQPGDDLRRIHHKLSYKLSKTMIREFASFQQEQLLVYLDLHGSVDDCEQVLMKFYACAMEWMQRQLNAIVCWSAKDGNFEEEVFDERSLKRCMCDILSHPKADEEDNILYRSQLGTHICIRAEQLDASVQKGGAANAK